MKWVPVADKITNECGGYAAYVYGLLWRSRSDETGMTTLSIGDIMRATGMHDNRIVSALNVLESHRYIDFAPTPADPATPPSYILTKKINLWKILTEEL